MFQTDNNYTRMMESMNKLREQRNVMTRMYDENDDLKKQVHS